MAVPGGHGMGNTRAVVRRIGDYYALCEVFMHFSGQESKDIVDAESILLDRNLRIR